MPKGNLLRKRTEIKGRSIEMMQGARPTTTKPEGERKSFQANNISKPYGIAIAFFIQLFRITIGNKPFNMLELIMLSWALTFFVLALIAAIFGFGGLAAGAAEIAKILFFLFLVLFVVSLIARVARGGRPV